MRKAHPESEDPELEWRLSFSLLEKTLSRFIPETMRHAFLLCKRIFQAGKPNCTIQSYELKTCLYWLLKDLHWSCSSDNPVPYLFMLLHKLHDFYDKEELPNFFLPSQNIFDTRSDSDIQEAKCFICNIIDITGMRSRKKLFANRSHPQLHVQSIFLQDSVSWPFLVNLNVKDFISIESYAHLLTDFNQYFHPF